MPTAQRRQQVHQHPTEREQHKPDNVRRSRDESPDMLDRPLPPAKLLPLAFLYGYDNFDVLIDMLRQRPPVCLDPEVLMAHGRTLPHACSIRASDGRPDATGSLVE